MEIRFKIGKRKKESKKASKCLKCGLKLPAGKQRKFCNSKCRTRYYSLKDYNLHKNDPAYKKEKQKYHKKWRTKNKDRFNELMRKPSLNYQKKKALEKKQKENKK